MSGRPSFPRVGLLLGIALTPSFELGAQSRFREVSSDWRLDFRHRHGGSGKRYMVETMVGGVLLFDYDGDGDVDVFFTDGRPLDGGGEGSTGGRLYRNDQTSRFVDVTSGSGLESEVYGAGAAAGDVDGDGDLDLYLTAFGANRLFRNRGDGTFEEWTEKAGVGDPLWSGSAAFADVDRDGDLDLYLTNYVDFAVDNHEFCGNKEEGIRAYCHPGVYDAEPDRLYRNRGDGTFEEVSESSGLAGKPGAGLGVVWGDFDGDLWPDLYVANDETPNFLYRNRGDGTFEDLSLMSGTALSDRGKPEAGMGVDLGDYDGDGKLDVVVTNFELETNALYRNAGNLVFTDQRYASRLAEPTLAMLGFGVAFFDSDHDGDLDLVVANGHILDNASSFNPSSRYRQPNQLFDNQAGRFAEVADSGLSVERSSRGLALGDLDGDGDLDLVISNSNEAGEVYENLRGSLTGAWLMVDLRGQRSNRFGIGARVEVEASGRRQIREVRTGASFLSQSALTLHFGLGEATLVDLVRVLWPSGREQRLERVPVNRRLRVTEPPGVPGEASAPLDVRSRR